MAGGIGICIIGIIGGIIPGMPGIPGMPCMPGIIPGRIIPPGAIG